MTAGVRGLESGQAALALLPPGAGLRCGHPRGCGASQTGSLRPLPDAQPGGQSWKPERILWRSAFFRAAQALRDAAATKEAELGPASFPRPGGGPRSPGPPTRLPNRPGRRARPAPPHPGRPPARQPAPRLHGNGRAPEPGRGDEEEPQRLSHSPHRHRGSLSCPVDVRAQGAARRRRVRGTGWPRITGKPPRRARDCGSGRECAVRRRSPGSPRPFPASGFLRRLNCACAEAFASVS